MSNDYTAQGWQRTATKLAQEKAELIAALKEFKGYMIRDPEAQGALVAANDLLIRIGEES